jgi:hypothetical protein
LFLVLEATFAFVFWAMRATTDDIYGATGVQRWARSEFEYDGLCSHCSLAEGAQGDFGLTSEELTAQAAEFAQRRADYFRTWRTTDKARDTAQYKAKAIKNRNNYLKAHPGVQKAADKKAQAKAVATKKHYCAVCDHAFIKKAKLTAHLAGPKHAAKAAKTKEAKNASRFFKPKTPN